MPLSQAGAKHPARLLTPPHSQDLCNSSHQPRCCKAIPSRMLKDYISQHVIACLKAHPSPSQRGSLTLFHG